MPEDGGYRFTVKAGKPLESAKNGTKLARGANFQVLLCQGAVINDPYIKAESMGGRMGSRLMAVVAEGDRRRVYISPTPEQESVARQARPSMDTRQPMNRDTSNLCERSWLWVLYLGRLFTDRQLVALTTFSDLVAEARERVQRRRRGAAGMRDDGVPLRDGGTGATAYAEAVDVYLAFAIDRSWRTLVD